MSLDTLIVLVVSGLSGAALLFIVGSGLSLVFGALRLINMAHGSLYMVGAFLCAVLVATLSGVIGFAAAIVVASVAVGVLGGLIEIAILRRLYQRDPLMQLVATFSLILIISGLVRVVFGSNNRQVNAPSFLTGSIPVGGLTISAYQVFLILVASAVAVGLWVVLYRTGLGRNIRAAVADPELLGLAGVNVPLLFTTVFVTGAVLAGLGGAVIAPYHAVGLGIDVEIVVEAFAVTIIGGLGSIGGAMAAAIMLLVISDVVAVAWSPTWAPLVFFAALVVVLSFRPQGLFGKSAVRAQ